MPLTVGRHAQVAACSANPLDYTRRDGTIAKRECAKLFEMLSVRVERWLRVLVLCVLAGFALVYLVVALPRVAYPFDIDFLEDDVLI